MVEITGEEKLRTKQLEMWENVATDFLTKLKDDKALDKKN